MDMTEYLKNPLQLDEICRTCLCKKDGMKTIFEACLEEMVKSFTNIEIKKGDGLPELICRQCVLAISRAYSFKKMCEKNADILKFHVSKEFADELIAYKRREAAEQAVTILDYPTCSETQECVSVIHMASTTDRNNIKIRCEAIPVAGSPDLNADIPIDYENPISPPGHCDDVVLMDIPPGEESSTSARPLSKYNCTKCKQSFDLQVDYKLHMLLHPLDKVCQTCEKVFTGTHAYKRHLKTHLLVKPHVCDICNKSFAESSNLQKHKKRHTGELRNVVGKPHLCSVCGMRFKWSTSLSKHFKYHTGKKLLTCEYCPRQYVEPRSLQVHMRGHTGERPYKCGLCERSFTQHCNLQKHLRTHTGEKPYVCDICGKGFSQKGYIQIHMRTHTGEKPYVCNVCGKGFTGGNALLIHKRIHSGEKPYQCPTCDKQFTRQESLAIHLRCHSGERPHKCTLCHKGFNNTGHLQSHMRSHTGEKPYSCNICEKRFATNGSLKVHLRMHTGEKPYLCGVCGKSFSQSSTLATHMNIHSQAQTSTNTLIHQQPETQEVQIMVHQQELVKPLVDKQSHILVDPNKPHIAVLDKNHITLVEDTDKQTSGAEEKQHIMIIENEVPTSTITWCIMKNVSS